MSEHIIKIIPRTVFTFTNLQASTSQTIVLASEIEVDGFEEVDLLARWHVGTTITTPATQTLAIGMYSSAKTYDDPTLAFNAFAAGWNTPTSALNFPVLGTATAGIVNGTAPGEA